MIFLACSFFCFWPKRLITKWRHHLKFLANFWLKFHPFSQKEFAKKIPVIFRQGACRHQCLCSTGYNFKQSPVQKCHQLRRNLSGSVSPVLLTVPKKSKEKRQTLMRHLIVWKLDDAWPEHPDYPHLITSVEWFSHFWVAWNQLVKHVYVFTGLYSKSKNRFQPMYMYTLHYIQNQRINFNPLDEWERERERGSRKYSQLEVLLILKTTLKNENQSFWDSENLQTKIQNPRFFDF